MARPIKQGIEYFPLDVGFLQDIKVRKIMRACGIQSIPVLISLLAIIYRDEGYYAVWDKDMPFLVADELGISEGAVTETVNKAVQVDFFDAELFEKSKVLTSIGIQKRFFSAVSRRTQILCDSSLMLIPLNDYKNLVNVCNNSVNEDQGTQSKAKESKGKESKANMTAESHPKIDTSVFSHYENCISPVPTERELKMLADWQGEFPDDLLVAVIDEAVDNNARSIKYMRGILNNLRNEGVVSVDQFRARKAHRARKAATKASNKLPQTAPEPEDEYIHLYTPLNFNQEDPNDQ